MTLGSVKTCSTHALHLFSSKGENTITPAMAGERRVWRRLDMAPLHPPMSQAKSIRSSRHPGAQSPESVISQVHFPPPPPQKKNAPQPCAGNPSYHRMSSGWDQLQTGLEGFRQGSHSSQAVNVRLQLTSRGQGSMDQQIGDLCATSVEGENAALRHVIRLLTGSRSFLLFFLCWCFFSWEVA